MHPEEACNRSFPRRLRHTLLRFLRHSANRLFTVHLSLFTLVDSKGFTVTKDVIAIGTEPSIFHVDETSASQARPGGKLVEVGVVLKGPIRGRGGEFRCVFVNERRLMEETFGDGVLLISSPAARKPKKSMKAWGTKECAAVSQPPP
ncbi:hypothetical protein M407DRAFT_212634 [Tulasnella calospora MUT 4182]|uniref:Uncharacterized protein n=1 Tax=Tulasnella calospora MUT 4182 TaxID=1051891 RepID=A0A0C3QVH4_9AGAM|nr:hypothetical protein M407DRAFT_212634 [Tulasnella calospora MUT 4182]